MMIVFKSGILEMSQRQAKIASVQDRMMRNASGHRTTPAMIRVSIVMHNFTEIIKRYCGAKILVNPEHYDPQYYYSLTLESSKMEREYDDLMQEIQSIKQSSMSDNDKNAILSQKIQESERLLRTIFEMQKTYNFSLDNRKKLEDKIRKYQTDLEVILSGSIDHSKEMEVELTSTATDEFSICNTRAVSIEKEDYKSGRWNMKNFIPYSQLSNEQKNSWNSKDIACLYFLFVIFKIKFPRKNEQGEESGISWEEAIGMNRESGELQVNLAGEIIRRRNNGVFLDAYKDKANDAYSLEDHIALSKAYIFGESKLRSEHYKQCLEDIFGGEKRDLSPKSVCDQVIFIRSLIQCAFNDLGSKDDFLLSKTNRALNTTLELHFPYLHNRLPLCYEPLETEEDIEEYELIDDIIGVPNPNRTQITDSTLNEKAKKVSQYPMCN